MMQRGFGVVYILVGVLILSFVAGGAFYLGKSTTPKPSPASTVTSQPTATPDASPAPTGAGETANWKTYTNTKYGFSISYPQEKTEVDCSQYREGECLGGGIQLISENNETKDIGHPKIKQLAAVTIGYPASGGLVDFILYSNPDQLTAREWWQEVKIIYSAIHQDQEAIDIGEKSFGQLKMFSILLDGGIALQTYYLNHNNYMLEILDTFTDEKSEKLISTFKFLQ